MEEEFEVYGGFASVYDLFMDEIPYDEWFEYLQGMLKEYGIDNGIVVDLACGTGEMTRRLRDAGYDMIGVDFSEEMLEIAREKCGTDVLLLHQDLRELDLYGTAKAMVCVCDGMNYLCEESDLEEVFRHVSMFLDKDGVFIFDMKTDHFYREVLGNRTLTDNRDNASYIWENIYHEQEKLNEYLLTVYQLVDEEQDLFMRTDELHRQRAYEIEVIKKCLAAQGFYEIQAYEAMTKKEPTKQSERVYFTARKK